VFLGALGVHRHSGSWMRSVTRAAWSEDLFDMVAPPARLWFQAICFILFGGLAATPIAWVWFDAPLVPAAALSFGLAALVWAWSLHHRARTVMGGGGICPENRASLSASLTFFFQYLKG
jgi:hypothetical protein